MTSAIEIHTHQLELQVERALASIEGLSADSAYMGDLDGEIEATVCAYVGRRHRDSGAAPEPRGISSRVRWPTKWRNQRPAPRRRSDMPVASFRDILDPAFQERYGVAAFNVVDGVSLQAVIDAATELDSPLIVQTSVKTVKSIGAKPLYAMFRSMADEAPVPITLHLDHCPEREWATTCLETGWNSVLFDGSHLDIDENTRQTAEVVEEARGYGADVEERSRA